MLAAMALTLEGHRGARQPALAQVMGVPTAAAAAAAALAALLAAAAAAAAALPAHPRWTHSDELLLSLQTNRPT